MRYNPPPNWPAPPHGWEPTATWRPDPSWGPPPDGWPLWVDDGPTTVQPPVDSPKPKLSDALKHPVWISVGTVVGTIALLLAGVSYFQSEDKSADLEVAAVTIENVTELQGANLAGIGNDPGSATTVGATPVDVTLKNNGDAPVTIANIEAKLINDFGALQNCTSLGAGPSKITAEYALRLPADPTSGDLSTQPVLSETDFQIEPGSVERLTITVGPEKQLAFHANVFEVGLWLIEDDGTQIELPNVVLITTQDQVTTYLERIEDPANRDRPDARSCVEQDLKTLDAALKVDGVHSNSAQALRDAYAAFLANGP